MEDLNPYESPLPVQPDRDATQKSGPISWLGIFGLAIVLPALLLGCSYYAWHDYRLDLPLSAIFCHGCIIVALMGIGFSFLGLSMQLRPITIAGLLFVVVGIGALLITWFITPI